MCGICLLLGSTNRAKSHSTERHRWSGHDHEIIGENVSNPPQTEMPDRCMEGRLEKGMTTPHVVPKILGGQAVPKAQEIGLHLVPVGSLVVRKIQTAPPVAEIEFQAKPPNPAEMREIPKDPRARVKETRLEPLLQARARGVGAVGVCHPAAVAVEGAIIVWIRNPVQIRCQMQTEITSKMP